MPAVITTAVGYKAVCVAVYEFNITFPEDHQRLAGPGWLMCLKSFLNKLFFFSFCCHKTFFFLNLISCTKQWWMSDTFYSAAWKFNLKVCDFVRLIATSIKQVDFWLLSFFLAMPASQEDVVLSVFPPHCSWWKQLVDGFLWNVVETFIVLRGRGMKSHFSSGQTGFPQVSRPKSCTMKNSTVFKTYGAASDGLF